MSAWLCNKLPACQAPLKRLNTQKAGLPVDLLTDSYLCVTMVGKK
jgi:hypothetical protein